MSTGPNTFGSFFRIVSFGESHGHSVGVVLDGVRPGLPLDKKVIQKELDRRKPGQSKYTSPRKEPDRVEILSGVFHGLTTGAPICLLVKNTDADPKAYEKTKDIFRPGHADYTFLKKYGIRDWRGGGRASGRETIGRVAAGAVAKQILENRNVTVMGFTKRIGPIEMSSASIARLEKLFNRGDFEGAADLIESSPVRCPDPEASKKMEALISETRTAGDSVGGVVEVRAFGTEAGWGDPVFWKLDAELAAGALSIGGVKGVEFGDGFSVSRKKGSETNDPFLCGEPTTNRAGGVLGGISNGAPIIMRLAVKPTPSIRIPQKTCDIQGKPRVIETKGRHDPCLAPRVTPVAEAMMSLCLAEAALRQDAVSNKKLDPHSARLAFLRGWEDLFSAWKKICCIEKEEMPPTVFSETELKSLAKEHSITADDVKSLQTFLGTFLPSK